MAQGDNTHVNWQIDHESIAVNKPRGENLFFREIIDSYVKSPRFLRRDWLSEEVQERLQKPDCRFLLLTAKPGTGKSTFIAQLAHDHPVWPIYFIRRNQQTLLSDVDTKSFLLRIGFQLSAIYPEFFTPEQVKLVVEQRIGRIEKGGEVVAAEVEKVLASPFYETLVQIQQQVNQNKGKVTGIRIKEWVLDPRLLEENDLQNMALIDPAQAMLRDHPDEKLVILVDALDEIRYHPDKRTLLQWLTNCPELPQNVRFILTSRPSKGKLVTFSEKQRPYLETLTIEAKDDRVQADLRTYVKYLIVKQEVKSVLAKTEQEVEGFSAQAVEKAKGNIGYLDALARGIDQALTLENGLPLLKELLTLRQLPDHIQGLYAFFLHQIKTAAAEQSVKVKDPETNEVRLLDGCAWPELYKPILNVLSVALEPLTINQIKALSGTLAVRDYVVEAIDWLLQFLDLIDNRYRFYHATLPEFLTAISTLEQAETEDLYVDPVECHRQICNQIETNGGLADIWKEISAQPLEQGRREYARQHYITHLFLAREWNRLFAVLDTGQFGHAKLRYDPSTYLFAQDVKLARQATVREELEFGEGLELLHRLWRYSLLERSLASQADSYPPQFFEALVLLGREREAYRQAELITNHKWKATTFGRMAAALLTEPGKESVARLQLQKAYEIAGQVTKADQKSEVLTALLTLSNFRDDAELELRALNVARGIEDKFHRSSSLSKITDFLFKSGKKERANQVLIETLDVAREIKDDSARPMALYEILYRLAQVGACDKALQVIQEVEDSFYKVSALTEISHCLYQNREKERAIDTLLEAQQAAHSIGHNTIDKVRALCGIAVTIIQVWNKERATALLEEALKISSDLEESHSRVNALCLVSKAFAEIGEQTKSTALLEETLELSQALDRAHLAQASKSRFLRYSFSVVFSLASKVAIAMARTGNWKRALEVARSIQMDRRADSLEAVLISLINIGELEKAQEVAYEIRDLPFQSYRDHFMINMKPIESGNSDTHRYSDDPRSNALCTVAISLAKNGNWDKAIQVAQGIRDSYVKFLALGETAKQLILTDEKERASVLISEQQMEIRRPKNSGGRDNALSTIFTNLLQVGSLEKALEVAGQIYRRSLRGKAVVEVADNMAQMGRNSEAARLSALAESFCEQIKENTARANAMGEIAIVLSKIGEREKAIRLLAEAQELIKQIKIVHFKPGPMVRNAENFARIGEWDKAIDTGRAIEDTYDKASAMNDISRILIQAGEKERALVVLKEAREVTREIEFPPHSDQMMRMIVDSFALMEQWDEAWKIAEEIEKSLSDKTEAMSSIAYYLAQTGRLDQALEVVRGIQDKRYAYRALRAIVAGFLKDGLIAKALEIALEIEDSYERTLAMIEIASSLAHMGKKDEAVKLFDEARDIARKITDRRYIPKALSEIVTKLTHAEMNTQALHFVQQEWLEASTREDVLELLAVANSLISLKPEHSWEFYQAITWVDEFLKGG